MRTANTARLGIRRMRISEIAAQASTTVRRAASATMRVLSNGIGIALRASLKFLDEGQVVGRLLVVLALGSHGFLEHAFRALEVSASAGRECCVVQQRG